MFRMSKVLLLFLSHFVWVNFYPSQPIVVLELAVPIPALSIFQIVDESVAPQCRHLIRIAVESNYHVTKLMKLAVCLHQLKMNHETMELYQYIHNEYADYSFVLANMALLKLTAGEPYDAKKYLDLYFQKVGGIYGESSFIQDREAHIHGPTCIQSAVHKSDCVYALNLYASAHMQLANNSYAHMLYKRALYLADEDDSSVPSIYANLGDLLGNFGNDPDAAADYYISSFWKSFRGDNINPVSDTIS